jgi:hypothetical protein
MVNLSIVYITTVIYKIYVYIFKFIKLIVNKKKKKMEKKITNLQ